MRVTKKTVLIKFYLNPDKFMRLNEIAHSGALNETISGKTSVTGLINIAIDHLLNQANEYEQTKH
jgi:hypothetical protein